MPKEKQDTKHTAMSVSKDDLAFYTEIRDNFAAKHGMDASKLSVQTVIKTAMAYYAQRLNYIKSDQDNAFLDKA